MKNKEKGEKTKKRVKNQGNKDVRNRKVNMN
jgi:hypothetical protein